MVRFVSRLRCIRWPDRVTPHAEHEKSRSSRNSASQEEVSCHLLRNAFGFLFECLSGHKRAAVLK